MNRAITIMDPLTGRKYQARLVRVGSTDLLEFMDDSFPAQDAWLTIKYDDLLKLRSNDEQANKPAITGRTSTTRRHRRTG